MLRMDLFASLSNNMFVFHPLTYYTGKQCMISVKLKYHNIPAN